MSMSKRKWGVAGAVIAVIGAVVLWVACRGCNAPGDRDDGKDAHTRMCEKRHPPFRRLQLTPPRGGKGSGSGVVPKAAGTPPATRYAPKSDLAGAAADALPAPQPLLADAPPGGDGDAVAALIGDCPSNVCGVNGTWLGSGVPFRTLHLSPYRHNEANLAILGFFGPEKNGHRERLTLRVDGDRLMHVTGDPLHPTNVLVERESILLLGPAEVPSGERSRPTYEITIKEIQDKPFQIDCAGCTSATYPLYVFSARSLDDGCELEVCDPSLDDGGDAPHNLLGNAVIFQGDFYEPGYTVKTAASTPYDDDTFNIACTGTAISKLHILRHTSASQGAPYDHLPPPVDKRQALLRLLTADYCGAGHPFTHDGVRLHLNIDLAAGHDELLNPLQPPPLAPAPPPPADPNTGIQLHHQPPGTPDFVVDPGGGIASVDALWNSDGATCIETPRGLVDDPDIWKKIEAVCRSVNHPVKRCSDAAPGLGTSLGPRLPLDSYAISQNVPPGP